MANLNPWRKYFSGFGEGGHSLLRDRGAPHAEVRGRSQQPGQRSEGAGEAGEPTPLFCPASFDALAPWTRRFPLTNPPCVRAALSAALTFLFLLAL